MDEKVFTPFKSSPLLPIFEKFSKVRDVSLVYGDPIEMQGRTIIPVAKVKYSVGAGAGFGFEREGDEGSPGSEELEGGQGEGAGGAFQIKPVGIYDVTNDKAVYRPIVPIELILLLPLMTVGLAFMMASNQDKPGRMEHNKKGQMRMGSRCKTKGQGMKMKGRGMGMKGQGMGMEGQGMGMKGQGMGMEGQGMGHSD
ncbi:spore germination protein GerW family protein [Planococcus sp. FY231025]|uniref:spore germination protein GerW family protein n=1 Tax=Planococcus sp. FY231025 TaxID=3455699 RepID=UPI003F8EFCBA